MPDGKTTMKETEQMTVEVKPGFDSGDVLTFPSKGNQAKCAEQSCLKVKFELDNNQTNFKRKRHNLIYTHKLSLADALTSRPFSVKTLDNRVLQINLDDTLTPQYVHKIPGEGMPIKDQEGKKGDLFISFDVQFPQTIKPDVKTEILDLLS